MAQPKKNKEKNTYTRIVIALAILTILCTLLTFNNKAIKSLSIIIAIIILGAVLYLDLKLFFEPFQSRLLRIRNGGPIITRFEILAIIIGIILSLGIIYFMICFTSK